MPTKNTTQSSIQYTDRQLQQLSELRNAGHGTNTDIIRLALDAYYNHWRAGQSVTVVSKKIAEYQEQPEVLLIDGKPWLNLGSGLLAEHSAAMLTAQVAGTEIQRNALNEVLVYNNEVAADNYQSIKVVIMWKFV